MVAAVEEEARVHDLQPAAADEDGAAAAALLALTGGVAAHEGEVLQHQPWRCLVLAVRRGPAEPGIAGVHVDDPTLVRARSG